MLWFAEMRTLQELSSATARRTRKMTDAMQNPIDCNGRDQNDWSLHSFEVEAELGKIDRQAGHDYVPMDVFVDPRTRKEHFQSSSIRSRWSKFHLSVA